MSKNINYWMFRVSNKWGYRTDQCLNGDFVYCGWNIGLSHLEPKEILEKDPWASKMAIKFTYIKEGDIIIMPVSGGIAVGEAGVKEFREDLDWQDTLKVKWLTRFYPRKSLSSNLQSSLKYRGTFLNLNRYSSEFENLLEGDFLTKLDDYNKKKQELLTTQIETVTGHLSERKLHFQDVEFEDFVMHLLEIHYSGLTGDKNNQKQEAIDGKDLTMSLDFDDFDINIKFNIQVKQHSGDAGSYALEQISKSDDKDPYVKNIVVTTANLDKKIREEAKDKQIILFGPQELASMIVENFENIDEQYQAKLNLLSSIQPISEIENT